MVVHYSPIHTRELRLISSNLDKIAGSERTQFVSHDRAAYIIENVKTLAQYLQGSTFVFCGGLSIPLLLNQLPMHWPSVLAITKQFNPNVSIFQGFYRNHQSVKLAVLEQDLVKLVQTAQSSNFRLFERTTEIKLGFGYKRDSYKEVTISDAPKRKNLRFLRLSKEKSEEEKKGQLDLHQEDILTHIDIFIHSLVTLDPESGEYIPIKQVGEKYISPSEKVIQTKEIQVLSNDPCLNFKSQPFTIPLNTIKNLETKIDEFPIKIISPIYLYLAKERMSKKNKKGEGRDKLDMNILTHLIDWLNLSEEFKLLRLPRDY